MKVAVPREIKNHEYRVALTPAGKGKHIYRLDESELMYFGPRTPASLRKIAGWLHPHE